VRILSIVHQADAGPGVFAAAAAARDVELVAWTPAAGQPPEGAFDGALILGGSMHPDQGDRYPWLRSELRFIEGLLEGGVPTLGVCLGAELVAQAAGGSIRRLDAPEFGWFDVTLTPAGQADPVLGGLPGRFVGFQSHSYAFEPPPGAQRLALGDAGVDAFRSGAARGIQFHPEVTPELVERWLAKHESDPAFDTERVRAETAERIDSSTDLGRRLFAAFLDAAEPGVVHDAAR
jgi:GMP synthase-like glutamine amidotransferase